MSLRKANDRLFEQITGCNPAANREQDYEVMAAAQKHKEAILASQRKQVLRSVTTEELAKLLLSRMPSEISMALTFPKMGSDFTELQKNNLFEFYAKALKKDKQ